MPELLSFLITAILVLYIVRSLARIFLPMLFQSVVNKAQQQQSAGRQQNYNTNSQYNTSSQQEKIKVEYMPTPKKGSIPDSEGDFIDYEEVK